MVGGDIMKTFKKILKPKQDYLKKLVVKYLEMKEYKPIIGDGFVYAKGDIPIMLVAHMDTVHKEQPKDIFYDSENDVLWSPQGIGGDDRCGVYALMKILETHKPYVCFTEDEEIGCVGAGKFVKTIIPDDDVKFIIEIDRRGSNDCVFYDCGNEEFKKYIESFGFETQTGSYSDIVDISDEWEIASVNLSAGYYNEHTFQEIIKFKELNETIEKVKKILDDADNVGFFDYEKIRYNYPYSYSYYGRNYGTGYTKPVEEAVKDDIEETKPKTADNINASDLTKIEDGVYLDTKSGQIVELNDEIIEDDNKLE